MIVREIQGDLKSINSYALYLENEPPNNKSTLTKEAIASGCLWNFIFSPTFWGGKILQTKTEPEFNSIAGIAELIQGVHTYHIEMVDV